MATRAPRISRAFRVPLDTEGRAGREVCFYRPFRSTRRVWTAKKAAQAVCYAKREGATNAELEEAFGDCFQCEGERRHDPTRLRLPTQGLQRAAAALQLSATLIDGLRITIRGVLFLSRLVPLPAVKAAQLPLLGIERNLNVVKVEVITAREAALRGLDALKSIN